MRYKIVLVLCISLLTVLHAQEENSMIDEYVRMDLEHLMAEAVRSNPEIRAALYQMDVMEARIPQASSLDPPEIRYMREEMPGFRWGDGMGSKIELMQMIPFPSKLSMKGEIARFQAEHAHHEHMEKINEVLSQLKTLFAELWFTQQNLVLTRENLRLMQQFSHIAQAKYTVGQAYQQDVLKSHVEIAKIENEVTVLRQKELTIKAELMAILNRSATDTLGFATIPEQIDTIPSLDSLLKYAIANRSMLQHDSLVIDEGRAALSLARREYLPDFKIAIEYLTSPITDFRGWTVSAGITLPIAPWTLGKTRSRVTEAEAELRRSQASYEASRNMVIASVRALYYEATANRDQLRAYQATILPQARHSLQVSQTAYQTGATDFLMLIDAYRTLVDLSREYYATRLEYDRSFAKLERSIGSHNVYYTK